MRIQRAERLIHQQHGGVIGQCARQRDALFHAAGQFLGVKILKTLRPTISISARHCASASADFTPCWRGPYITCQARSSRETAQTPGTPAAIGTGPGDRLAFIFATPSGRIDEAADDIEQRRFSAADGPRMETKAPSSMLSESPTTPDGFDARRSEKPGETRSISIIATVCPSAGAASA